MHTKISVQIEKTASGYSAYSPEIQDSQVQGDTFDHLVDALKPILAEYLQQQSDFAEVQAYKPIWEIAQDITKDMTAEEIGQLPRPTKLWVNYRSRTIPREIGDQAQ